MVTLILSNDSHGHKHSSNIHNCFNTPYSNSMDNSYLRLTSQHLNHHTSVKLQQIKPTCDLSGNSNAAVSSFFTVVFLYLTSKSNTYFNSRLLFHQISITDISTNHPGTLNHHLIALARHIAHPTVSWKICEASLLFLLSLDPADNFSIICLVLSCSLFQT